MDSLSESMTKHLCPTCCGIVIIKTQDTTELYCPDYKPDKGRIKSLAYKDNKANITARKSKALMDLNI